MFILVAVVAGVIVGFLRGGSLRALAAIDLRLLWLVPLGFLLQVVAFSDLVPGRDVVVALHLISYAVVLAAIAVNLHLRSLLVVLLGAAANAVCIAANGGFMPASPEALRSAGLEQELALLSANGYLAGSTLMNDATLLPFLGDVLALPAGTPLSNVFSVGDVVLALGLMLFLAKAMVPAQMAPQGDYAAALDLIKRWPTPTTAARPSGHSRWRTYHYEPLNQA